MRIIRHIGSLAFVCGLFTALFAGIPWYMFVSEDPVVPWWLRTAVLCILGGILVVLLTVALEQRKFTGSGEPLQTGTSEKPVILSSTTSIPNCEITDILGLVQGHTVYAIWLGNDLSALIRLILGGELTEYTDMMGKARTAATGRMIAQAQKMDADAIINVRYMTTSVVGSAAELLAYGTAVKLST